jgi:hypothetical protein
MSALEDPFAVLVVEQESDEFATLSRKPFVAPQAAGPIPGVVTARLHGFDLEERPLVAGLPDLPGEIVPARTTVPLVRAETGSTVVVACEGGDPRRPIVLGVIRTQPARPPIETASPQIVSLQVDDDRLTLSAEREIVLKCGAASITLTRAGKVLIKGAYILSRSSGYNKIKGAAVDIN